MRVLVTGACGFIGRHFVKRLLDDGHFVTAIDNLSSGIPPEDWMFKPNLEEHGVSNFQMLFCDVRGFCSNPPNDYYGSHTYDLIIHCAAVVGGRLKIENDPLAVATDLAIDSELFHWVTRIKPMPKVIYFSSSAAYPTSLQSRFGHLKLNEKFIDWNAASLPKPDMTYGFVKLAGEYLAKFAVEKYGLDVKIYRPFGGYGEDQSFDYPFPTILRRIVNEEEPIKVWGSGEQQRDFIHVDDVVECVLTTYDKIKPGEALNIGTGCPTSFFKLAEMAIKLRGVDLTVINDVHKPEGVFSRVADPARMAQFYKPRVTLEEGIKRVFRALDRAKRNAVV